MFLIENSKYEQIIFGHAYWLLWKTNTFSAFLKEGSQTALSVMNEQRRNPQHSRITKSGAHPEFPSEIQTSIIIHIAHPWKKCVFLFFI